MKKFVLTLGLLIWALPAQAAMDKFNIDSVHSEVGFKIRHFFGNVPGRFTQFNGAIEYDAAKPEAGSVTVEIMTDTINTDNSGRDSHLKGADFFDTKTFPKVTFKSTSTKKGPENKLIVIGDLTIRNKTKPVTLEIEVMGIGKDMNGIDRAGFHGTTKINRKDFGISWNKTLDNGGLMLGEDVSIDLNIEATKGQAAKK